MDNPNFQSTEADGRDALHLPKGNYNRRRSSYYDISNQKSLRHYLTGEALPKESQYRDLSSIVAGTDRPTLDELHESAISEFRTRKPSEKEVEADLKGVFKLGWFKGVTMSCLLNIWSVMLFLRVPWVIGEAGIVQGILIMTLANTVSFITVLSMSAVASNGQIKGGGVYYMISRSLGPQFGASIGLMFTIAISIAVAVHSIGFTNAVQEMVADYWGINEIIPGTGGGRNDVRILAVITVIAMLIPALIGMEWVVKVNLLLLITIIAAQANFVTGAFIGPVNSAEASKGFTGPNSYVFLENLKPEYNYFQGAHSFFSIFAIFFPAVTGIEAGANISGDLKDPSSAIPKGTLIAVGITYTCYITYALLIGGTCIRHAFGNETAYLAFQNDSDPNPYSNPTFTQEFCPLDENGQSTCTFGLENDFKMMEITAGWGPLIYIGTFAASLSSVIACLVGSPRMLQALAKDKLYPLIHIFAKGYGPNDNPIRGYGAVFLIAFCCIMIGDLNAVAALLTNFYLTAYSLINFSCFHASLAKSPGWRPAFKFYNMWVSLIGALMIVAVMFLIDWVTALCTYLVLGLLYCYMTFIRKPDANWGSSNQAQTYVSALKSTLELVYVEDHVKNYRPQILLLSGNPEGRPSLVDFVYYLTKNLSMLTVANVVQGPVSPKMLNLMNKSAYDWMSKHNIKAFYSTVEANDLEAGSKYLFQICGLGKLRPNVVVLGYKGNWRTCDRSELKAYFNTLHKALDMHFGVAILRVPEGFDYSNVLNQDNFQLSAQVNEVLTSASSYIESHANNGVDSTPPSSPTAAHSAGGIGFDSKSKPTDLFRGVDGKELPKDILDKITRFRMKQPKGTIDVWWLYDDGGLTMLLPYILSSRSQFSHCKLRVFGLSNRKDELEIEQRSMATLLNKFRIDFSDVIIVPNITFPPEAETKEDFNNLIKEFRINNEDEEISIEEKDILITEEELLNNKDKIKRHQRLREVLLGNSQNSSLVVMTLPMPRKNHVSATLYMSWLEMLTKDMPPMLLVRGNQSSVLTFYS